MDEVDSLEEEVEEDEAEKIDNSELERERRIRELTGQNFHNNPNKLLITQKDEKLKGNRRSGNSLLTQADQIKKKEKMKRLKDLDSMNKLASDQGKNITF